MKNRGWGAVALAAVQVMGLGTLYAWSVLIGPVQSHFDVDRTATGLVFSVSIAVFTLAVMAAPRLFAAQRLSVVGTIACFLGAGGLAAAAVAPTFAVFVLSYGGLFAAASGLGYSAGLQMAVASGVSRTGLATGVIVATFALGAVILGPMMGHVSASGALKAALFIPAVLLAGVGVLSLWVQRACTGLDAAFAERDTPSKAQGNGAAPSNTRLTWLLWWGFATGAAGGLMVLGHAAGIIAEQGGSVAVAGIAVSMIAVGNATGRLTSGAIADRLGPRTVLLLAALMLGVATGMMAMGVSIVVSVVALAVTGLSYGVMATGYPVAVHRFYGATQFASVYGRVFTAWGIAGLISPFVAGWMFDNTGSYSFALLLATGSAIISALTALMFPGRSQRATSEA
ncbi:MFS transporter [Roseovarius aestuarii]|nr:MFS transporter [Roseovarius aestuarii]